MLQSHFTLLRKNNFWIAPAAQTPGAAWLPTQPPLQLEYLPFPDSFWHIPVEVLQGKGFSVGNDGHRDMWGSSAEANICIRAPTAALPPWHTLPTSPELTFHNKPILAGDRESFAVDLGNGADKIRENPKHLLIKCVGLSPVQLGFPSFGKLAYHHNHSFLTP